MGRLHDGKILGGIGSILELIPGVSIVGYILTLIGVKYLSDELQDPSIFSDMMYAVITAIVGIAVAFFFGVFGILTAPFTLGVGALAGIFLALAIAWIALVISAMFIRRAFEKLANRLNVGSFRTAGTLYFVGALTVIILIGFVILFVAYIIQIVAFFSIQDTPPTVQGMAPPVPAAAQPGTKFCASCGTQMSSAASFCPKCGAAQPA